MGSFFLGKGPTRRRLVFFCGVLPVLLTGALAVFRPSFLVRIDDTVYDTLMRSTHLRPISTRVAIVDVDERSLSMIGQWPWRRDVIARLIARLRDTGAAAIAMDMIFAEPDRYEPLAAADRPARAAPQPSSDDLLADTLRGGRVVLGYGLRFEAVTHPRPPCALHPIGLAIAHPGEEQDVAPFFRATGAVCSLAMLGQAASMSGFLNAAPDSDGILRRVPLLAELDGRVYPSLGLATVAAVIGRHDFALRVLNIDASSLTFGDRAVPVDG